MTDDQHSDRHGEGTPQGGGRWNPLPQGDYDDGATAFVQLPEGGIDAALSSDSPLAAPGQYVPPQITVTPATTAGTDPAATGTWSLPGAPVDGAQWQDRPGGQQQAAQPQQAGQQDGFGYDPRATGQWSFEEATAAENAGGAGAGQDVTGQWSIPVANGDLPDESGEFTTSSLIQQWGGTPPPTLPGGAPAPWATTTQSIGRPWGPGVPGVPQDPGDAPEEPPAEHGRGTGPASAPGGQEPEHPGRSAQPAQPTRSGADEVPDPSGVPGAAASEEPEHTGPRSSGGPRRSADEAYPAPDAEPGRPPQAPQRAEHGERPEDARDEHREHPHPGEQDAVRRPAGPGAQDAGASSETAESPADRAASGTDGADATDGDEQDGSGAPRAAQAGTSATDTPASGTPTGSAAPAPASAAAAEDEAADEDRPPPVAPHDDHPLASYVLRVNGTDRPVSDAWIGESLLYVLRERLGLAGAKDGCSQGECGACNVQVDGRLVASCLVPAVTAAGSEVRTVEGLAQNGQPSDVQRALARCGAVQCGFCVPGMAMTVHDLLEGNPAPTELETRQALCGNLCRCSGYRGVVEAVKEVVAEREAHSAAAEPGPDADEPRIPHQAGPGAGGVNPSAFQPPNEQPYGQDGGQA